MLNSVLDQFFGRQLPKIVARVAWVIFQCEIVNVFIVDIVVWTLLGGVSDDFVDLNVHAINMGLMLLEFVSNQIVLKPACVVFLMWVVMAGERARRPAAPSPVCLSALVGDVPLPPPRSSSRVSRR